MATQNTYNVNYAQGFPGMIANTETRNVISRNVQDAAGLAFGVPVFQGAYPDSVTATPGTAFRGISVASRDVRVSATGGYNQFDSAGIMTQGVIWVTASHAVVAGEPVYMTSTGLFTDVAAGDTAIPNALFNSTGAAGTIVKVRLG